MQTFQLQQLLLAGAISGAVGLLTFLIIHHFTIRPIWFILPVGSLLALAGGAAVGWAFELLSPRLPANLLLASFAVSILLTITQLPGFLIGSTRDPILDIASATILPGKGWEAFGRFAFDLFLTAAISGAALGWWLGGSGAAARMAVAAVAFSIGPGHNIPFFAGTIGAPKMWGIMGLVIFASGLAFAAALFWFAGEN